MKSYRDSRSSSTNSTPPPHLAAAAVKIQSAYRSHVVRALVRKISSVRSDSTRLQRHIQRQETVDSLRRDPLERVRINEALMALLLRLDEVPGFDPTVRELRRRVSRRIVGMQEIVDGVVGTDGWDYCWEWDDVVGEMEEGLCREKGGVEMERFCAHHLGFRCFQRFLRDH